MQFIPHHSNGVIHVSLKHPQFAGIELSDETKSLRGHLDANDQMLLASLHNAPAKVAAATLELSPLYLRNTLYGLGLLEPHPKNPDLVWISAAGWELIDELATLWSEEELVAHFEAMTASRHEQKAHC